MSVRIAIISTPRTGSTWLRLLLMDAYAIPGLAVPRPDDLDWAGLPEECVLQLHWHRTPALLQRLGQEGFRVVSVTRHPLDVLISILQFCLHDDSTLQWLDGEGGDERPIQGTMPGSAAFLEYAAGPRAAALMAVSQEWASAPETIGVRYEELIADTQGELRRIVEVLEEPMRRVIAEVAEGATIPKLRHRTGATHHFWQGRHGLWRSLLTRPIVERLAAVYQTFCAESDYSCIADPLLAAAQADANWLALIWPHVTEKLRNYNRLERELAESRNEIRRREQEYAARNAQLTNANEELARGNDELTRGYEELASYHGDFARGHEGLVKSYQELQTYCLGVERVYKEAQQHLLATRKNVPRRNRPRRIKYAIWDRTRWQWPDGWLAFRIVCRVQLPSSRRCFI